MRTPSSGRRFTRAAPSQSRSTAAVSAAGAWSSPARQVEAEERAARDAGDTVRRRDLVEEAALREAALPSRSSGVITAPIGTLWLLAQLEQLALRLVGEPARDRARRARRRPRSRRRTGIEELRVCEQVGSPVPFRNAGAWRCSAQTPAKPSAQRKIPQIAVRAVAEPRRGQVVERARAGRGSSSMPAAHSCAERSSQSPSPWTMRAEVRGARRRGEAVQAEQHPRLVRAVLRAAAAQTTPVSDRMPPAACATRFDARQPGRGPVCPNGGERGDDQRRLRARAAPAGRARARRARPARRPRPRTSGGERERARAARRSRRCAACRTAGTPPRRASSAPRRAFAAHHVGAEARRASASRTRRARRRRSRARAMPSRGSTARSWPQPCVDYNRTPTENTRAGSRRGFMKLGLAVLCALGLSLIAAPPAGRAVRACTIAINGERPDRPDRRGEVCEQSRCVSTEVSTLTGEARLGQRVGVDREPCDRPSDHRARPGRVSGTTAKPKLVLVFIAEGDADGWRLRAARAS